ncbi:MAG: hypothetical protein ACNA8R_12815, partial [Nitriliruptoraceae bacterium]
MTPASLPPEGLPGLAPRWSRLVRALDADGRERTWHVLDTAGAGAEVDDEDAGRAGVAAPDGAGDQDTGTI